MTSLTGYGDQTIDTQGGRLWASFHMLISVAMLGELISTIDQLNQERSRTLKRIQQLSRRLDDKVR